MKIWEPGEQAARSKERSGVPTWKLGLAVMIFLGYIRNWSESCFPEQLQGSAIVPEIPKLNWENVLYSSGVCRVWSWLSMEMLRGSYSRRRPHPTSKSSDEAVPKLCLLQKP